MAVENVAADTHSTDTPPALQCGHGSMAVENGEADNCLSDAVGLQCGHGSMAVENGSRRTSMIYRHLSQPFREPAPITHSFTTPPQPPATQPVVPSSLPTRER